MMLLKRVRRFVRQHALFRVETRVVVALSGGGLLRYGTTHLALERSADSGRTWLPVAGFSGPVERIITGAPHNQRKPFLFDGWSPPRCSS